MISGLADWGEQREEPPSFGWLFCYFLFDLYRLPASTASWLIVGTSRKELRLFRFLLVHSRNCEAILTTSSEGFSGLASIRINPMGLACGLRRPTRACFLWEGSFWY